MLITYLFSCSLSYYLHSLIKLVLFISKKRERGGHSNSRDYLKDITIFLFISFRSCFRSLLNSYLSMKNNILITYRSLHKIINRSQRKYQDNNDISNSPISKQPLFEGHCGETEGETKLDTSFT